MDINFKIEKDKLSSDITVPFSGNVNYYHCIFTFSDEWADLTKYAVFMVEDKAYTIEIIDNACIMPKEVLYKRCHVTAGIFGTNGASSDYIRISTNPICFFVNDGSYVDGETPEQPTPDIWEIYLQKVQNAANNVIPYIGSDDYWYVYDADKQSYAKTNILAKGQKGEKGDTGYTPIKGVDYFTSADIESLGIDQKQDKLTFDTAPTADSTNPVTSGGVKTALDEKADKTEVETVEQTANYARDTANTVTNKVFSTIDGLDTKADKTDLTDYLKITDINSAVRSVRPAVKNTIDTIAVNTIYDLGVQTALNITLPSGQIGNFVEVDFISGSTATTLTVNSSSGLVGFDLIPGTNTIYTLYFDWGETGLDGTDITYGWRCNYSEYSIVV